MRRRLLIGVAALSLGMGNGRSEDQVFLEKGGIVVIEAESTTSRLGNWEEKIDVEDFSGECHLEFTGNKPESKTAELLSKRGDTVNILVKGVRHNVKIATLSEADQQFIAEWEP